MGKFDGHADIEAMSSEELERFIEQRLQAILTYETNHFVPSNIVWHAERALEAVARWRHLGTPVPLFSPDCVAPRSLHAVEPLGR
jgi:hypothetical protein